MKDTVATAEIAALYEAHGAWLRDWLSRRTRCAFRADDLAQDTFCRLLEQDAPIQPHTPRSFLATVARRLLIDDVRRRDIERAYADCYAQMYGDVDALTPERITAAARLLDGILTILSGLPDGVRAAFLLRRVDGLSHDEIAAELKISVRTVKRYIAQAYVRCYTFAYGS